MVPAAVAAPRDPEDLALLVTWAARGGHPLFARGSGTGMPGGNVGPGICVDLSGWTDSGEIDTEARRVTVGPGVIAARLEEAAGAHGLRFPALPSSAGRCTLGGMLANNSAGVHTFRHGAVRDWVDALEVVLPDGSQATFERAGPTPDLVARAHAIATEALGQHAREWPDVRKNASGYALDRFLPTGDPVELLIGSEGTLGIITRARLRLQVKPMDSVLALIPVPELRMLPAAIADAEACGASACEFFAARYLDISGLRDDPELGTLIASSPAALLVEVEGGPDAVDEGGARLRRLMTTLGVRGTLAHSPEERARLWQTRHAASPMIAARASEGLVSMQFIEDSVVRPDHLSTYLEKLGEILAREETDAVMFGHAGDGNVHVNPLIDVKRPEWRMRARRILEATVELVSSLNGTLSGEHGDGRIRAPFHGRIFGERTAGVFRAIKEALDPAAIMNPGVLVPLPGQDPLAGLSPDPRRAP